MDIFESKNIKPMLIGVEGKAFDSNDYIYELKLDGIRCIAFLDKFSTELRNKRNLRVAPIYPELSSIHEQVNERCILDGELIVMKDGKPEFSEIQKRSLMSNKIRINLAATNLPVSFTAFDILYYKNKQITDLALMERKKLLKKVVNENEKIAVSRYIEEKGISFYQLAEANNLEGIVAKRKVSKYYFNKRTKDWIKIKYLQDDDFVVCGYIEKSNNIVSIILGQYDNQELLYKGHVTLGISQRDFTAISSNVRTFISPFKELPSGNENAIWIFPDLVCTVKYMQKTNSGFLRQPIFKGLRNDKSANECYIKF